MIVDLITIKDSQTAFNFLLQANEIDLESETAKVRNTTKVEANVKKGIAQTDVKGKIYTDLEIECSRCLQPTENSFEIPFSAVFVTPENYTEAKEAELKGEDLEVSIFEGDKIDLKELVREQILLNLPIQVFCREDCKGLCQKCGANLNLIDCNCEEKEVDPRWAALKNLK
ncbi:MAG: DUF177 domain-containing protein [Acidobacteria bacterium]|nr:DUF177 domain-containing protein [Acidobacteriota bacterium]MCA1638456.1 DUF177 domain-containing protein [Acidobacteriota bacterium]